MDITDAFAATLLALRRGRGLTHEELAEKAGLHPTTVSLFERGKRQPTLDTLFKLAAGLGMAPDKLVHEVARSVTKSRRSR